MFFIVFVPTSSIIVSMTELQRKLALGALLAFVIIGAIIWFTRSTPVVENPGANSEQETTTVNGVTGTGQYTVESVTIDPPKLGPIVIQNESLSPEVQVVLRQKIEQQYEILRKEPKRTDIWLHLGVNRKIAGDYKGAVEAWEYVAAVAPKASVATARANLGDLYMYFIKDYVKAKENLKAAIQGAPQMLEPYRALFYLEKDINKDPAAARAVIELGLKNNPDNADLLQLKSLL